MHNYQDDELLNRRKHFFFTVKVDGMQYRDEEVTSPDMLRPLVIRALRRSSVRKKIADYLFEISPSGSYTAEIAHNIKTTPTNVIGAMRGMNSRYKNDESLIGLNMVEQITIGKNNSIKLYKITDFGKDILESIKD